MNKKIKKLLFVTLGVIISFVAIMSIYAMSRKVALKNDEILLSFEQNDPTVYTSENTGITYYEYDCDNGHVICQYEPYPITVVRDNKRDFVKEYRYNILFSVIDLRVMAIFDFFHYEHWWPDFIRSDEEVTSIRQLLADGNYSEISSRYNGKTITTTNGTVYVS